MEHEKRRKREEKETTKNVSWPRGGRGAIKPGRSPEKKAGAAITYSGENLREKRSDSWDPNRTGMRDIPI